MDFYVLLTSGATLETVLHDYQLNFVRHITDNPGGWRFVVSHQFIKQCFNSVNLNFTISVDEFRYSYIYPYREANMNYVFHPASKVLGDVEEFLEKLPQKLLGLLPRLLSSTKSEHGYYELIDPVQCYLRVINDWCNVVGLIIGSPNSVTWAVDKFFCEPLARLSCSILCGIMCLVNFLPSHIVFNYLCSALTSFVRLGMLYGEANKIVLKKMLKLFQNYHKIFCGSHGIGLQFAYHTLSCEINVECHIEVYEFLAELLTKTAQCKEVDANGCSYIRSNVNELIKDNFLKLQCKAMSSTNTRLVTATFQYLLVLQNHIASTEVFSPVFIETILGVLLRTKYTQIRILGARAYVNIMSRLHSNTEITAHILETFFKLACNKHCQYTYNKLYNKLSDYLIGLWQILPATRYIATYLPIVVASSEQATKELKYLALQSWRILFNKYMNQYGQVPEATEQVHEFLAHYSLLFKHIECMKLRFLLITIYKNVDFALIIDNYENNKYLLTEIETVSFKAFLTINYLKQEGLEILYEILVRSVRVTGNENQHTNVIKILLDKFLDEQSVLYQQIPPEMLEEALLPLTYSVARLNVVVKHLKLPWQFAHTICEALGTNLVNLPMDQIEIISYGYELMSYIITQKPYEQIQDSTIAEHREARSKHWAQYVYITSLHNLSQPGDHDIRMLKTWFCCISILPPFMQQRAYISPDKYNRMLDELLKVIISSGKDTQISFCLKEIMNAFQCLHACEELVLPAGRIWKVLVYYKHHTVSSDVSFELGKLIRIILKRSIIIYANSLPIIITHLWNERATAAHVLRAFTGHLELIDKYTEPTDAWFLKIYAFKNTLENISQKLNVGSVNNNRSASSNRLLPLKNVLLLIHKLCIDNEEFQIIGQHIMNIKEKPMNTIEMQTLDGFLKSIREYKYRCDVEITETARNNLYVGALQKRPTQRKPQWVVDASHRRT